jgi:hypothetical protein
VIGAFQNGTKAEELCVYKSDSATNDHQRQSITVCSLDENHSVPAKIFQLCGTFGLYFDKQAEMFPYEEFWRSAVFGAIGGLISVFFLKLLENTGREFGGPGDFSKSLKRPQEHDERLC